MGGTPENISEGRGEATMDIQRTKELLEVLADGIDPSSAPPAQSSPDWRSLEKYDYCLSRYE